MQRFWPLFICLQERSFSRDIRFIGKEYLPGIFLIPPFLIPWDDHERKSVEDCYSLKLAKTRSPTPNDAGFRILENTSN